MHGWRRFKRFILTYTSYLLKYIYINCLTSNTKESIIVLHKTWQNHQEKLWDIFQEAEAGGGGHHHVQVAGLGDHGVRVDLAHVVTLVLGLDVLDVKGPGVVTVVDDVEPGDPGDDVPPYGEDHLAVYVDPGNLDTPGEGGQREAGTETHLVVGQLRHHTLQRGLPAQSRRDVADILGDVRAAPAHWE